LAVVGCVGPAAPSVTVPTSADRFTAACEAAFTAAEELIDEVVAILKASGTSEGSTEPIDLQAMEDHLDAARKKSSKALSELPDGYESDLRLKNFADKMRTVQSLTGPTGLRTNSGRQALPSRPPKHN
jgi:hypothetical protein